MPHLLLALAALFALSAPASAKPLTAAESAAIDRLVTDTLKETGVPSASISVVRGGEIVLGQAYGKASETIPVARADLPYQIGSISKQFTTMGILLLEDEGKLSLDDKVSKWLPGVSGGGRITIRRLLSHTAGLQEYGPQEYMLEENMQPVTPQAIVDRWGKKGLDFDPGSQWRYSNTGYVVAGMILEKAAGEPLMAFLKRRVFDPAGVSPLNHDDTFTPAFPTGYTRYALGPVRLAPKFAPGWMFATGMLSMTAADLAKWNIARLNRAVFPAEDWIEQERPVLRHDATTNGYGLGVSNILTRERRIFSHAGGLGGFVSRNNVYPDSRAAITVLTNADFSDAINSIAIGIEKIILRTPTPTPAAAAAETPRVEDARALYDTIVAGQPDRSRITHNLSYYFNPVVLGDFRTSLAPLGPPVAIELAGPPRLRGGFVGRSYTLRYPGGRTLELSTYAEPGPNGRWEQFLIRE